MTTQTRLALNIPPEWLLTANMRLHWAPKARRTRWIRQLAELEARQARVGALRPPQRLVVEVRWANHSRRRDTAQNLQPTIKAAIDGMVDAGLLPDDSDAYLIGPDIRVSRELADRRCACALTFEFRPAEGE